MTVTGNANAQIIVSTHGKIESSLKSRKPIDLSSVKAFVIDEADIFFSDDKNFGSLKNICDNKALKDKKVQYILFSATYPAGSNNLEELVMERISQIIAKAQ
jgi:superfamily II DNA/RNA helicase